MTQSQVLERGSFGGHETFPLRYAWLPKAVAHVAADPEIFQREDAMVSLGVGKNMVRAIRHWGIVCGMIEEDSDVPNNRGRCMRVTALGDAMFGEQGWDRYLEDPASLWVIQHELVSQPDHATTWYWVFNHLPQPEFSKGELLHWLESLSTSRAWSRVSPASLKRDIDVFFRTYVPAKSSRTVPLEDTLDCPLVELGLLREIGGRGSYVLQRGDHPSLPDPIFAYALIRYLERREDATATVPVHAIAFAAGSPGRAFGLTEESLMRRLENIERVTDGALVFHDTAGLRQLVIRKRPDAIRTVGHWYKRRRHGGVA